MKLIAACHYFAKRVLTSESRFCDFPPSLSALVKFKTLHERRKIARLFERTAESEGGLSCIDTSVCACHFSSVCYRCLLTESCGQTMRWHKPRNFCLSRSGTGQSQQWKSVSTLLKVRGTAVCSRHKCLISVFVSLICLHVDHSRDTNRSETSHCAANDKISDCIGRN